MGRGLTVTLFSLVIVLTVAAQGARQQSGQRRQGVKAPRSMPSVEQILDRYVRAIGGEAAWRKLTTRVIKGTSQNLAGGLTGSFEIYAQAPNRRVQSGQARSGDGAVFQTSRGFNGLVGWSLNTTETGFRELSGTELAAEKREAEFYREVKLKALYSWMTRTGLAKVGGREAYVVEAAPATGSPERWYFDTQTGLLVRRDVVIEVPKVGQVPVETYLEDYREVDGIKLPFAIRHLSPAIKVTLTFSEVKHNAPIEEAKFSPPGSAAPTPSAATVDEYIRAEMKRRRIPGLALAVIKDGEVVKLQGYGLANLEHDVPVTPDTVFDLASVTKQFTATAVMLLAEEGRVKLDDPVTKYLPRSPRTWARITVRHLLTHTAGLGENTPERIDLTAAEAFASVAKEPLGFTPGARYQYSNVGYFLLGLVIEKASGQPYRDFLAERFFKPLGMASTSVIDQWAIVKNRAAGYTLRHGQLANIRRIWQDELPSDWGVLSTARDLAKWETALAAGRVVKESSLAAMWTPVRLRDGRAYPYGFGWEVYQVDGRRVITHSGISGTEYTRLPDDKLTVIVLTNLGVRDGDELVDSWGLTRGVAIRYLSGLP